MIMLILRILRARPRRALGVLMLAAVTLAIAVGSSAYLAAADRSVIATELAHASTDETSVRVNEPRDLRNGGGDKAFETDEPGQLSASWLVTTFAVDTNVIVTAPTVRGRVFIPQLAFRQGYCAQLTVLSGRCPVAVREVVIDEVLANTLHLRPGDTVSLAWARKNPVNGWSAAGPSMRLSVVGVYRPINPKGSFWGTDHYFTVAAGERGDVGPVLTDRGTLELFPHQGPDPGQGEQSPAETDETARVDATLRPGALTPDLLPTVRARIARLTGDTATYSTSSAIPALLDRIEADRTTMRRIVPAVAVPLVLLGCLVLFLVVAYAAGDRRPEIAAVRLHGAGRWDRWAIVAGESVLPVLFAVPLGLLGAPLLAWAAGEATLPGRVSVPFGAVRPTLAAGTLALMLLLVLAGCRRVLAEPVNEVIRAVPARISAWRSYTLEVLVVAIAGVAVAQLYLQTGPLSGLTLGAPALVVSAIAVLVGWLVPPVVARLGKRFLAASGRAGRRGRRPRLAAGLGALMLARRPVAQRLLAVQAIAVGLIGFVAATATAAADADDARIGQELGAARILSVGAATPIQLVDAVRAADPSGRYAMAAITVAPATAAGGAVLAVDTARLASVATWPSDAGVNPAAVAAALHPPAGTPVLIKGTFIEMTVTARINDTTNSPPPGLFATLEPLDGSAYAVADFGPLVGGEHTYRAPVGTCAAGCRLAGVTVSAPQIPSQVVSVTVHHLDVAEPQRSRVDLPWTDDSRWRLVEDPSITVTPTLRGADDGLTESSTTALQNDMTFTPRGAAYPLPALVVGAAPRTQLNGMDGAIVDIRPVGQARTLPRVGGTGVLVDIEALDRLSTLAVTTPPAAEVWLAADAPPGIDAALEKAGLVLGGSRTAAAEKALLEQRGPAVAYRFGLVAAGAAVLLAAACVALLAGVDRRRRVAELGALRVQGLRVATARRATVAAQLGLVAAAGVTGCLGAFVAWRLTGSRLPVFADAAQVPAASGNGPLWALLIAAGAAVAVLVVAAVGVAVDVGRGVAVPVPAGPDSPGVGGTPRQDARRGEVVGSVR